MKSKFPKMTLILGVLLLSVIALSAATPAGDLGGTVSYSPAAADRGSNVSYSPAAEPGGTVSYSPAADPAGIVSYTYDDLGQVVEVHYPNGTVITYTYDAAGNRTGYVVTAPSSEGPSVTTYAASNVTTNSATLNGDLTGLGSASSVQVSFEWGLTTDYGNETTPETMTGTEEFGADVTGLTPGTTYYFRAKAVGDGIAYGDDMSFTTPPIAPPTLQYPADGTFTSDNTPWLDWSDVTDPSGVHYQLQVDNNTDFSSPEVFKTWVSLSSTTLAELPQGVYYWRVRAVDDVGNPSDWSESWSLTVTPAVPALVYPANWTKTKDNTPWLDWSDVTGDPSVHYQLQVDDNADFSSPEVYKTWVNLSSTTLPVLPDGLYYWRVRAVNGADIASGWSGARAFTIDTLAPPVPTLIYPVNGKVTRDNTAWLDWSNVTDVTGVRYQLQVDDNADFSSPAVYKTVSLSSNTLPVLPDGVYYWRVRAVDGVNNASDWSYVWIVTVDTAAPPMPTLTSPADGTSTADNTPWLDWTDVTDATVVHYQLQADDNTDFSSPAVNKTWVNLSSTTLAMLPDGVYYWRVRVVDAAGNMSAWTSGWSFTVAT